MRKTHGPVSVEMQGRLGTLTYEEGERRLEMDLELSGVTQFTLLALASHDTFAYWTEPVGLKITDEGQRQIVLAIRRWEVAENCAISL